MAVPPIWVFIPQLMLRPPQRIPVDFRGLEGLVRLVVAVHSDKLAHPAPARVISLAIENEVDGFGSLGTYERVIEIWPGT